MTATPEGTVPEFSAAVAAPGTVAVHGEVDLATAPELRSALTGALRRTADGGPTAVTVDLRAVNFFDSAGVALLYEVAAAAALTVVVTAGSAVDQVVRISGLSRVLRVSQVPAG